MCSDSEETPRAWLSEQGGGALWGSVAQVMCFILEGRTVSKFGANTPLNGVPSSSSQPTRQLVWYLGPIAF